REDLEVKVTSDPNFKLTEIPPTYVILQDGRRYFENIRLFNYIETNYEPIKEVHVVGGLAAKIYKISDRYGQEQAFANSPTSTISATAEDKKLIVQ
ncbi:MAG: hypothetical protein JNN15_10800, partial [Blastocatellia bacterium]|nr:hypothetical protein [Blastocatellia bacterium]